MNRYKVISIDITKPTEKSDLIPQHSKDVLSFVATINSVNMILSYLHDVVVRNPNPPPLLLLLVTESLMTLSIG